MRTGEPKRLTMIAQTTLKAMARSGTWCLFLCSKNAGQQAVLGGLEQRPGHAHDGVEHREQQGEDQRDADDVLDPAGVAEDVVAEAGVEVSGSAVFSDAPSTPTKTIAVPM